MPYIWVGASVFEDGDMVSGTTKVISCKQHSARFECAGARNGCIACELEYQTNKAQRLGEELQSVNAELQELKSVRNATHTGKQS